MTASPGAVDANNTVNIVCTKAGDHEAKKLGLVRWPDGGELELHTVDGNPVAHREPPSRRSWPRLWSGYRRHTNARNAVRASSRDSTIGQSTYSRPSGALTCYRSINPAPRRFTATSFRSV
jgi:hypothetical protein